MPALGGTGRLALSLVLSFLLHLTLLAMYPNGLPRLGSSEGLSGLERSLNLSFITLELRGDGVNSLKQELPLDGVGEYLPAGKVSDDDSQIQTHSSVHHGLSAHEETGPPYPPPAPTYLPSYLLEASAKPLISLNELLTELDGSIGAGRMVFIVLINADGDIDEVLNESSTLEEAYVVPVKILLSKIRFQPGMKEGKPVKSSVRIEVNFSYSVY